MANTLFELGIELEEAQRIREEIQRLKKELEVYEYHCFPDMVDEMEQTVEKMENSLNNFFVKATDDIARIQETTATPIDSMLFENLAESSRNADLEGMVVSLDKIRQASDGVLSPLETINLEEMARLKEEIKDVQTIIDDIDFSSVPELIDEMEEKISTLQPVLTGSFDVIAAEITRMKELATEAGETVNNDLFDAILQSCQELDVTSVTEQMEQLEQSIQSAVYPSEGSESGSVNEAVNQLKENIQELKDESDTLIDKNTELEETIKGIHDILKRKLDPEKEIPKLTKWYEKLAEKVDQTRIRLNNFGKDASIIPGPVGKLGGSIEKMTKASWKFIMTPIGAVLTAISVALQLVSTWFNRTEEGQESLMKITAAFTQTLEFLADMAAKAGEAIFGFLSKIGKAVIPKGLFGDPNEAESLNSKINKRIELQKREKQLAKDNNTFLVRKAEIQNEINDLQKKIDNSNTPEKERLEAEQKIKELMEERYNTELQLAQEKYDLIKQTNELETNINNKDEDAEAQALATLTTLQGKKPEYTSSRKDNSGDNKKLQQDVDNMIQSSQKALEEARLSIMEEGKEKRLKLSEKEHKEKKAAIEKEYNELKEKYKQMGKLMPDEIESEFADRLQINDQQKQTRDDKIHSDAEEEFQKREEALTAFSKSEEEKRIENIRKRYDKEREWAKENVDPEKQEDYNNKINAAERNEILGSALKKYQDYDTKRRELEQKFDDDLATLNKQQQESWSEETQKAIEKAQKLKDKALADLDNAEKIDESILTKLFEDMSKESVKNIRAVTKEAEELIALVKTGEWDQKNIGDKFNITEAQFNTLKKSKEELKKIEKQVESTNKQADGMDTAFGKLAGGFEKVFSAGSDTKGFEEGMSQISSGMQGVTGIGGMLTDSLKNLGELTGNEAFGKVADGLGDVMEVAGGAMKGAQAGMALGPIGAAVGAVAGLASSMIGMFAKNKAHRQMLQEQIRKNNEENYLAEIDVNRQWRERYEWAKKIGESTLSNIKRQGEELKKQSTLNAKDQDELMKKLTGTEFKENEYFKKTGLFGKGKGKIVEEWSSLAGKSWEEIELFAAQGKLSEDGQKYYEALKAARQEGEDLAKRQEEYLEMVKETFTGSSYDGIVDSIVEGFKAGKRSAEDFADTFEDMMQNAVVSALKLATDERARKWYDQFAAYSEDGLTEAEIEELNKEWQNLINEIGGVAENLEKATGMSLSSGKAQEQTATSKGFETMTQDQGTELNGRFTSLQMAGEEIRIENRSQTAELIKANQYLLDNYGISAETRSIADEIRTIQVNSYIELMQINDNTEKSAKSLKHIESDIQVVKQKIANL